MILPDDIFSLILFRYNLILFDFTIDIPAPVLDLF